MKHYTIMICHYYDYDKIKEISNRFNNKYILE